ncbi:Ni/Fe-hydrogenase cytochrome b subunit [Desulfovermiculus halophilus]|uniref:Ni/Fe-hydrogenase cytochrome b subunit n=1 Tax=Desulfovermiculus halophilus TaxID=339722 RepID=UPI0006842856|nr:Ni/Fe-hydrogenase cytochrome b subunit [Desulfovermiculus halophilus]
MAEARPAGGRVLTVPFVIGIAVILIAGIYMAKRFIYGLGPVTGMNDGFPWGLWIAYDVNVGTAFACGGYAMAVLIYIFNRFEYSPLLKPAILTSMFGYILGGFSVFIDIGRYWQMHNVFLPWHANVHSALFEVALCIATYCLVLLIEFAPVVFKRYPIKDLETKLNRILFVFVALGMLLPTMHQSSLGSLMVLAGAKLSPLWWSKLLPLFFLMAAMLLGYAIVIFETSLSSLRFNTPHELKIVRRLSSIVPWVLGVFILMRIQDINAQGALGLAFQGDLAGNMFLIEMGLMLVGLLLIALPGNRQDPTKVLWSALCILLGVGLYRFNAYIIGYDPGNGWHYFPAVGELMITLGIIAVEILGYLWIVKRFPVLALPERPQRA